MDMRKVEKELSLLAKHAPKKLRNKLTKFEDQHVKEKEMLKKYRDHPKTSVEEAKRADRLLEGHEKRGKKEVIDYDVEAKLDKIVEGRMNALIKKGVLPDPKDKRVQEYYRKFMESRNK